MSLINDALKKAQRQQSQQQPGAAVATALPLADAMTVIAGIRRSKSPGF